MKHFGWTLDYVLYKVGFLQAFHLFSIAAEMEFGNIDDSISDDEAEKMKKDLEDKFIYDKEKGYILKDGC